MQLLEQLLQTWHTERKGTVRADSQCDTRMTQRKDVIVKMQDRLDFYLA